MWMHTEGEHCRQTRHNNSRDASNSNYTSTDHDHIEKAKGNDSNSDDVSPAKATRPKAAGTSTAEISTAAAGGVFIIEIHSALKERPAYLLMTAVYPPTLT